MSRIILECCVDSVESAINAKAGGADRIELCSALPMGGLSPQISLYKEVRKALGDSFRIHVLLRPRGGDFLYSDYEFEILKDEVRTFRELGADGIVIGILRADGSVDVERCGELCKLAGDMKKTFHRAFDMTADYRRAYEDISSLGFDTVLSSGQRPSAIEGATVLRELAGLDEPHGNVQIMAGAGVKSSNLEELLMITGVKAVHMSAKLLKGSDMQFRQQSVSMGVASEDEFSMFRADEEEIRKARAVLDKF